MKTFIRKNYLTFTKPIKDTMMYTLKKKKNLYHT